jgi:hypothetical protein
MLKQIDLLLLNGKYKVKRIVEAGYKEAYECAPQCECDNIDLEYDQLLKWQKDISSEITEKITLLDDLIETEKTIITDCPDYANLSY